MKSKKIENLSFEEAYKALEEASENLKDPNVSLDEAMKAYEEGIKLYNYCNEILLNAKQKIEVLSK